MMNEGSRWRGADPRTTEPEKDTGRHFEAICPISLGLNSSIPEES